MIKTKLLKSCQLLLAANIIFWMFIACYFSFFEYVGDNNYLIIKILLFSEPILYLVSFIGINKKIKIIYLSSIILAFVNTILSITDQIDLSDIISLVLSALLFLNLILIWKNVLTKREKNKS
jgi:hypothetical protein